MGPGALQQFYKGEKLAGTTMRTPLVELPLGATGALPAHAAPARRQQRPAMLYYVWVQRQFSGIRMHMFGLLAARLSWVHARASSTLCRTHWPGVPSAPPPAASPAGSLLTAPPHATPTTHHARLSCPPLLPAHPLLPAEDRICGTIDIEKALTEGVKAYEPGLLAKANRGILYVDEVNLLDDGLVDVVLDSGGCPGRREKHGGSDWACAYVQAGVGCPGGSGCSALHGC